MTAAVVPQELAVSTSILVICIHNSARSQMAEELIRRQCGDAVRVESAGLEPGALNPMAVAVLQEMGIDIAGKATQGVSDLLRQGREFDYVITVCDEASAERCPVFPGGGRRLHWSFPDPSAFSGSDEERLVRTREVRDAIAARVQSWCAAEECCAA